MLYSRSTKTLINKPSEVFDKSSEKRSESRNKKTTSKGSSTRRKEMASRYFKRKGVVFDDDDDDDDDWSKIPSTKNAKMSSTSLKENSDDNVDDVQSKNNARIRTGVPLPTTTDDVEVCGGDGKPRPSRKYGKSSSTSSGDGDPRMDPNAGASSDDDDLAKISTKESKKSKSTNKYSHNIDYSDEPDRTTIRDGKDSFVDELINRTKVKKKKTLSSTADIVPGGSGIEKSHDTTDRNGGNRGQHLSSLLDEFLDSNSLRRHSKLLERDTEMASYVNQNEDNQSKIRTTINESNDFISSSERKKSILDDFI